MSSTRACTNAPCRYERCSWSTPCLRSCVALLVLAQAFLLARVAARAFGGSSLHDVGRPSSCWGSSSALGRQGCGASRSPGGGCSRVISQLRLDVVDARLRRRPALDGTQTSEVTTAAVTGVDALEATFARYLPEIVVPIKCQHAGSGWSNALGTAWKGKSRSVDVGAARLVGRQTARKARELWQALALLSNHFLDVVRGLPTLRAFNRGAVQAERISSVSDEYRRTTMGTLRLAFLSGAIRARGDARDRSGRRRRWRSAREGNIGFEAALTMLVLLLSSTRRSGISRPSGMRARRRSRRRATARPVGGSAVAVESVRLECGAAPIAFERVSFRYPTRELDVLRDVELVIEPGECRDRRASGAESPRCSPFMRFAEPSSGRILVGGTTSPASIRRRGAAYRHVPRPTSSGDRRGKHQARSACCGRRGGPRRRNSRPRARLRLRASRRIRDSGRRRRTCPLDGREATRSARARVPARRATGAARRAHGRSGS